VQDFDFMGGSLGLAAGEAIVRGLELAVEKKSPFIVFAASGGARMQEGILSLMQMPRTTVCGADAARDEAALYRGADQIRPPAASPPPMPCSATCRSPSPAR